MNRVILVLIVMVVLTTGCAKRPETASQDYANYLAIMESIAAFEAQVDRTIWTMTTTEEVTLPAGVTMIVKAPPPALPVPEMWRDHAYEAELAYYGTIWSVVGGVGIPAIASMYSSYNSRKMITDIMKYAGGATFNAQENSQINFSGGWGDRSWGYQGGSFAETMDLSDKPTVNTTTSTSTPITGSFNPVDNTHDPIVVVP